MRTEGSTVSGTTYGTVAVDIPRPDLTRTTHRPWCTDCKRKHDADQLDDNGRCTKCARIAVARAEAATRREDRAAEIAQLERQAAAEVQAAAKKQHAVVRRTSEPVAKRNPARPAPPTPRLPAEAKQGTPTAPATSGASTASSTTGSATAAGTSTSEKASAGTTPPVPVEASNQIAKRATGPERHRLDPECAAATRALVDSRHHRDLLVVTARAAATHALNTLSLALEHTKTPAAATSTPAAAGPAVPSAPSPVLGPAPTRPPGTGKGKPGPGGRPRRLDAHMDDVIHQYRLGMTAQAVGDKYGVSAHTVLDFLRKHNEPIRPRGGQHGNHNARTSGAQA